MVASDVESAPPMSIIGRLLRKTSRPPPPLEERLKSDLPYDGQPEQSFFKNGKGLLIQTYRWRPQGAAVGVVVLMHGVRAHLRLTWLAKRALCLEGVSSFRAKRYSPCLTPDNSPASQLELAESLRNFLDDCDGNTPTSSEDTCASPKKSGYLSASDSEDDLLHLNEEERRKELFYQGSWIEALVEGGFEVYGMDLQGHGRSDGWRGKRCTAECFDDWRDDCLLFLDSIVRKEHPTLPLLLIGVSLSGQVAMRVIEHESAKKLKITGVALFSPLMQVAPKLQIQPLKTVAKINHLISKISPDLPVPIPTDPEGSELDWQRAVGENDPYLCRGPFTSHLVSQCLIGITQARDEVMKIFEYGSTSSILMIHNWRDGINPAAATVEAFQLLKNCDNNGEQIKIRARLLNCRNDDAARESLYNEIPGGIEKDETPLQLGHTMVNDIDNGYVFGILAEWIRGVFSSIKTE